MSELKVGDKIELSGFVFLVRRVMVNSRPTYCITYNGRLILPNDLHKVLHKIFGYDSIYNMAELTQKINRVIGLLDRLNPTQASRPRGGSCG